MGYSSGRRGQTVNLLANAFQGSNPCPTTIFQKKEVISQKKPQSLLDIPEDKIIKLPRKKIPNWDISYGEIRPSCRMTIPARMSSESDRSINPRRNARKQQ